MNHHEVIDKHEAKIDKIQQDVVDIKTRLGIKDITNGQVLKYHKDLIKAHEDEICNRKEADALLREQINKVENRTWMILVGIIIVFLGQIVQALVL